MPNFRACFFPSLLTFNLRLLAFSDLTVNPVGQESHLISSPIFIKFQKFECYNSYNRSKHPGYTSVSACNTFTDNNTCNYVFTCPMQIKINTFASSDLVLMDCIPLVFSLVAI